MLLPTDIHTHLPLGKNTHPCLLNGTSPLDWGKIARVAQKHRKEITPCFGVHPWSVKPLCRDWQAQLISLLLEFPNSWVGEIGLDNSARKKSTFSIQIEIFRNQCDLAAQYERNISVHLVKSTSEALPLLKEYRQRTDAHILCHGYSGGNIWIPLLLELNAYFSFGPRDIRHAQSGSTPITEIPANRILWESDGASAKESENSFLALAELLGKTPDEFLHQCKKLSTVLLQPRPPKIIAYDDEQA